MTTDKVGVLTAEDAKAITRRVDLMLSFPVHGEDYEALCEIASGAHVVIDTATHVAVEKMTEAQAREAFEHFASDDGKWPQAIARNSKGEYLLMATATRWATWQAATSARPAITEGECVRAAGMWLDANARDYGLQRVRDDDALRDSVLRMVAACARSAGWVKS